MTTPTPKPCPFCGNPEPSVIVTVYRSWVSCSSCLCRGPNTRSKHDAVAEWNAAPRPAPDPLREAALEALEWLKNANHGADGTPHHRCHTCEERWPCDVEQARRRLAAALDIPDLLEDR